MRKTNWGNGMHMALFVVMIGGVILMILLQHITLIFEQCSRAP